MYRTLRLRYLILIFLGSVTLFGCSNRNNPAFEFRTAKGNVELGGTLHVPYSDALPDDFSPILLSRYGRVELAIHLHEGLVRLHPETFEVISGLARSWSWDRENRKLLFEIRKDATFHYSEKFGNQSTSVNAEVVLHSFKAAAKKMDESRFEALMGNRIVGAEGFRDGSSDEIAGLEIIDDYRLSIQLINEDESFLYLLAQPEFAVIPLNKGVEVAEVGAGPFQLISTSDDVTLKRNVNYHAVDEFGNQFPYIDTLVFVAVSSNEDKLEKLIAGEIDVITNLELSPVRAIFEKHIDRFSGSNPEFIMTRESDNAIYDTYTILRRGVKGLGSGFMGYRDYSRVQIEQSNKNNIK